MGEGSESQSIARVNWGAGFRAGSGLVRTLPNVPLLLRRNANGVRAVGVKDQEVVALLGETGEPGSDAVLTRF